ncbi:50S ribosomal protein L4 [Mycoplasmopsis opalescens]|uniref:50S ribosomal protein L4 n=1 Tax=Mycoplasmopsis opalescens TaxID=114886 RepID=UPI0004A6E9E9|nr:50S ribosomal protein L4 [Mycoplasmopsis opalescens]
MAEVKKATTKKVASEEVKSTKKATAPKAPAKKATAPKAAPKAAPKTAPKTEIKTTTKKATAKVNEKAEVKAPKKAPVKEVAKTSKTSAKVNFAHENVLNFDNSKLPSNIFKAEKIYEQAIFDAIMSERASRRQGTHAVKSRAEVSGGGKKPWRQKGTGRARAGSTRSPIWVGGGRAWGPRTERNYTLKVNRKVKKAAFVSALTLLSNAKAVIVNDLKLTEISTKNAVAQLKELNVVNQKHILVVTTDMLVMKSLSNVPNVMIVKPQSTTVEQLVWADVLVLSNEGLKVFESRGL